MSTFSNQEQYVAHLTEMFKNGVIDETIMENFHFVDPQSPEGRIFQRQMLEVAQQLRPLENFTNDSIKFFISDSDDENAFVFNFKGPGVVAITKTLFNNLTTLVVNNQPGSFDRAVHVAGHELLHKYLSNVLGEGENSAFEELGADNIPLYWMQKAGFSPLVGLETALYLHDKDLTPNFLRYLFDVHPKPANRYDAITKALTYLDNNEGGVNKETRPVPALLENAMQSAKHFSYFDKKMEEHSFSKMSVEEKLNFIVDNLKASSPFHKARFDDAIEMIKKIPLDKNNESHVELVGKIIDDILEKPYVFNEIGCLLISKVTDKIDLKPVGEKLKNMEDILSRYINASKLNDIINIAKEFRGLPLNLADLNLQPITWPNFEMPSYDSLKRSFARNEDVTPPWEAHVKYGLEVSTGNTAKILWSLGINDPRVIKAAPTNALISMENRSFTKLGISIPIADDYDYTNLVIAKNGQIRPDSDFIKDPGEPIEIKYENNNYHGSTKYNSYIERYFGRAIQEEVSEREFSKPSIIIPVKTVSENSEKEFFKGDIDEQTKDFLNNPDIYFKQYIVKNSYFKENIENSNATEQNLNLYYASKDEHFKFSTQLIKVINNAIKSDESSKVLIRDSIIQVFEQSKNLEGRNLQEYDSFTHFIFSDKHKIFSKGERINLVNGVKFPPNLEFFRKNMDYTPPKNVDDLISISNMFGSFIGNGMNDASSVFKDVRDKEKYIFFTENPQAVVEFMYKANKDDLQDLFSGDQNSDIDKRALVNDKSFSDFIHKMISEKKVSFDDNDTLSPSLKGLFASIIKNPDTKWPEDLSQRISVLKAIEQNLQVPSISWSDKFSSEILKDLSKVKDLDRKIELSEQIILGDEVKDIKLRTSVKKIWLDSIHEKYGKDNGSLEYYDNLSKVIERVKKSSNYQQRYELFDSLANIIVSQNHLNYKFEDSLINKTRESLVKNSLPLKASEPLFGYLSNDEKRRLRTIDFLYSGLTNESLKEFNKYLTQDIAALRAYLSHLHSGGIIGSPEQDEVLKKNILISSKRIHDFYSSASVIEKSLLIDQLLVPSENKIEDVKKGDDAHFNKAFAYVNEKLFGANEPYAKEAKTFLQAHIETVPHYQKNSIIAIIMSVGNSNERSVKPMTVIEKLVAVITKIGPAERKIIQGVNSSPDTNDEIREQTKGSKTMADPDTRWGLRQRYMELLPEKVRNQHDHMGPQIGSASINRAVRMTRKDGRNSILTLQYENVEARLNYGFENAIKTIKRINELDPTLITATELLIGAIEHAQNKSSFEANTKENAVRIKYSQESYDGLAIQVGSHSFKFKEAALYAFGPGWKDIEEVKGVHFNDLPEKTTEQKAYKEACATANLTADLMILLSGRNFNDDAHGGNDKVDSKTNIIGKFDPDAMEMAPVTSKDKSDLGKMLSKMVLSYDNSKSFGDNLFSILKENSEGKLSPYLSSLQRAALAWNDYARYVPAEKFPDIIKAVYTANKIDPVILNEVTSSLMSNFQNLEKNSFAQTFFSSQEPSIKISSYKYKSAIKTVEYPDNPAPRKNNFTLPLTKNGKNNFLEPPFTKNFMLSQANIPLKNMGQEIK